MLSSVVCVCLLVVAMTTTAGSDELPVWAVRIAHATPHLNSEADRVASELGLVNSGRIEPFPNLYRFTLPVEASAGHYRVIRDTVRQLDDRLKGHQSVRWSSQQVVLKRTKRANPLIMRGAPVINFNDPQYSKQWHLHNTREKGHDINTTGIWRHNISGKGVVVAVVDDGVERGNSDLTANFEPLGSYDFNSDDDDPTPDLTKKVDNTHGTRCAGLIAAVANNSVCGVGVAHGGRVSGIRMLDGSVTDILEGQSFIYKAHVNHVYSCSWGPEDNGHTVEGPGPLAREALELGTKYGRYGYGNIYVFASGNGGTLNDNCNFDGYANSVYTLTVGAVDELNQMPYYAELCAAMLAVTYSNGQRRNIVTTDGSNHGGCTSGFSGTSAAAPIAAGMVALMLEVRPCLTWRDVQAIVVYSAVKVDAEGAEWVANAAGFHHSDQHGFGLMDAYRLTVTAAVWALLPVMVVTNVEGGGAVEMPPLGRSLILSVIVKPADIPDDLVTLEYVTMTMKVSHVCRGSLEITLTSPAGTPSTLVTPRRYDTSQDGFDWTFSSARFWGEGPLGMWRLNVTDHVKMCLGRVRKDGAVHRWTLTFYGSSVTPEEVARRQKLVEEAVSNGSVKSAFLCPTVNHTHHDIVLPDILHDSMTLLEKIGLTVVVVIIVVIVANFVTDRLCRTLRRGGRPRPPTTSVLYLNRGTNDSEETCALLIEEGADRGEGADEGHLGVNGNFNNNTEARVEVGGGDDVKASGDTVEVCSGDGVEVCVHRENESSDILVTANLTSDLDVTVPFDNDHTQHPLDQSVEPSLTNTVQVIDDGCHGDDDDEADETSKLLPVQGECQRTPG